MPSRRQFVLAACPAAALPFAGLARAEPAAAAAAAVEPWAAALIAAARRRSASPPSMTAAMRGSLIRWATPRERGVCCDVVIRAHRDARPRPAAERARGHAGAFFQIPQALGPLPAPTAYRPIAGCPI